MFENMEIIKQFPDLTIDEIEDVAIRLKDRFGYEYFPVQYGNFLIEKNGCLFQAKDEGLEVSVDLDLPFIKSTQVAGIFGVWLDRFDGADSGNIEWPELFASNENSKENFDVLPHNMMSFAYEAEGSGSLFAISTDQRDLGCVYFYYDEYLYTIIGRKRMLEQQGYCFFDRKLKDILRRHDIDIEPLADFDSSRQLELDQVIELIGQIPESCEFELSRNNFILVSGSFNEFMKKLKVE